jgi:hypothetical protein
MAARIRPLLAVREKVVAALEALGRRHRLRTEHGVDGETCVRRLI